MKKLPNPFKTALASAVLLIPFIVFCTFFVDGSYKTLTNQTDVLLREIAERGASKSVSIIQDNFRLMDTLIQQILLDGGMSDATKLVKLKEVASDNSMIRIGFADPEGNAESTDGKSFSVADRDYFLTTIQGKKSVSRVLEDRVGTDRIWVFAVPVEANGKIHGVLFATTAADQVTSAMDITFFNGAGTSYVISNEGDIIMSPRSHETGKNFYDILSNGALSDKELAQISMLEKDMHESDTGTMRLTVDGQSLYLAHAILRGINNDDLNMVCVIRSDYVFGGASRVVQSTTLFCISLLVVFVVIIILVIRNKQRSGKILYQLAYTDSLTGLFNFKRFCMECEKRPPGGEGDRVAVICFDVNHFKILNDTFGYEFGDHLLLTIASTLRALLKKREIYGRFSNDNFTICTRCTGDRQKLAALVHSITDSVNDGIGTFETAAHIDLSFGIYCAADQNEDIKKMIDKANLVRKALKAGRSNFYDFFQDEMLDRVSYESGIQAELEQALAAEQFEVYYQPQINFISEKIHGMEALIRWKHPSKGFISPAEFIPIAEKCGLIREIDRFVFLRVCRDLSQWKTYHHHLTVCVNISRAELFQPHLAEHLQQIVHQHGLNENQFELELTETVATADLDFMKQMATVFKEHGFRLAMDDFGTGSSSLSCLKNLSFDVTKLDRSFLLDLESDPRAKNIISSIIQLSKSLGLSVISEGVETREEAEFLKSAGCDIAQGYYYARPMPKIDFEEFAFHSKFADIDE